MKHLRLTTLIVGLCWGMLPHLVSAQAVCPSSGVTTDASGNLVTCTPTEEGSAPVTPSVPGNGGIFNCQAPGASSIAASSAIGGTFVPVYDAAVALNTGVLAYKECVLKELAAQQRITASLAYVQQQYNQFATGRGGNPYWVVNYGNDQLRIADQAVTNIMNSSLLEATNPAIRAQVQSAVVRNYFATTRAPQTALECPYAGLQSALDGTTNDVFGALDAFVGYPSCNPYIAYYEARSQVQAGVSAAESEWLNRLNWNNGIYDTRDVDGNVVVPGILLNAAATQAVTSGYRQLENVNDIGQMVGRYFAGLGSFLLSGPSSVASIQQYIGQAVDEQKKSLAASAVNTALTNLYQIIRWEQQYNDLQKQMASTISGAIRQLRTAENTCWDLIQQNVCSTAASSTPTGYQCSTSEGIVLDIATSTSFSNAIIAASNFGTLAHTLADRIDLSNQNLNTLNALLGRIQSTDAETRNTGLAQLDTIINANPPVLHVQSNITDAQNELIQIQGAISNTTSGVVSTAIHRWAGDDSGGNPGVVGWDGDVTHDGGWCNVPPTPTGSPSSAQQQTISNWRTAWTH